MEGYYCTINSTKKNPTDGVTGNECPIGHYCPKGSHAPIACSNGTFMNITGVFLTHFFEQKTFHIRYLDIYAKIVPSTLIIEFLRIYTYESFAPELHVWMFRNLNF